MNRVSFLFLIFGINLTFACTDFVIQAKDGTVVNGRSLEFAEELQSKVKFFARKQKVISQNPEKKNGLEWVSKYGYLGINAMGMNFSFDGMNEMGLSFGYLWLPQITEFPKVEKGEMKKALDFTDFGAWVLGNFSTVKEVKEALKHVVIWGHPVPPLGNAPVHAAIHDAKGDHLVVEFLDGKMVVRDNPISVLTNAPSFDWQIANLQNYLHLDAVNAEKVQFRGEMLAPPGQGSGFLGIPGDWTPPSRFVKIATYLRFISQVSNAYDAVNCVEHLLNTVDIPYGLVREKGSSGGDYTQWVVIKNLSQKVFYFRSYGSLALKMIDLKKLNFNKTNKASIPLDVKRGTYIDMSQEFLNQGKL